MSRGEPLTLGTLLRRARRAAALTQEQLAARAYMSVRALSDLERGVSRTPYADTIRLLADGLDLQDTDRAAFITAARQLPRPLGPLSAGGPGAGAGGPAAPPFVGRSRDLAALDRHLAGGGPPLLLVAGEPGIGKTRLLQAVLPHATGAGLRVLVGGCQRRGEKAPYAPCWRHCSATSGSSARAPCGRSCRGVPGSSGCCRSWPVGRFPLCPPGRCRRSKNAA
jgi:hypothetical protein